MNSAAQPKVSIVVPLYNNAAHLSECIESILAQTYQNWDCTIVNNCSTDASSDVASHYASMDRRIRIHNNATFLRAIANHNTALRLISSESKYCKVVFGDDWIFPECLERMVSLAEENPSVGIVGAYVLEGEDVTCTGLSYPTAVLSGRDACRLLLVDRAFIFGSANALLYRADLVRSRDPFYNETNIHADNEVCFALLSACDFGFVHQVLTYTRLREGSLNARSKQMQTSRADWIFLLLTYGRAYLSPEELRTQLGEHLSSYYRFLGKSLLQGQSQEFWTYHTEKMVAAGITFSRARLALGVIATLTDLLLNPKNTIEKLASRPRVRVEKHREISR